MPHIKIAQDCPVCGRSGLPRSAFRKAFYARGTSPYDTVCRECREAQGDDLMDDSPYALAEREVERRYGAPAYRWRNDRESPLPVLAYALALEIVNNQRNGHWIPPHNAPSVEDAERLCEVRGLRRVDIDEAPAAVLTTAPPDIGATPPQQDVAA